jgi:pimeloyl-ACP methyl ester carboxylesterase
MALRFVSQCITLPSMLLAAPSSLVRVGGVDIHYRALGEGRPLVLLHGLGDSSATWNLAAPELAKTRRVIAPDLAGHGLSARPDASYSLDWHAQVIGGWLDALGIDDFDLVGHSFGGGVAQWLLLQRNRRVRRLALVAPGGLGRGVSVALRLCARHGGVVERIGQPFMGIGTRIGMRAAAAAYARDDIELLAWMNSRPGTARAFARTASDVIDGGGQTRHFLDRAHEIDVLPPTAIFWGERDRVVPSSHAADAATWLDGVAVTRFDCGHFPHRERADAFARALGAFLDASDARPAVLHRTAMVAVGRRARASFWRRAARAFGGLFGRKRRPADAMGPA